MKLAFDNEIITNSVTIYTGVPQGSPVSPILFLIYANQLFKCNAYLSIRINSYVDNIGIQTSSRSTYENCKILQNAAEKLVKWGQNNHIEFDMKKTELIHFDHANRSLNESIKIKEFIIKPKEVVKWLGIWFDRKLSFKIHVENRIASASRMFYTIKRLANTEKGLSFQAMRKLYIACITSIANYEVSIWWKNQVFLLDKFKKLQNQALRRMLEAFKNSPITTMKIEAGILPVSIRFKKICKNYALRILKMQENHLIKLRISANSSFFN